MDGAMRQAGTIAWVSFRGGLRGLRLLGLIAIGILPTLVEAALVAGHARADGLVGAAESLYVSLTLPIVMVVVVLVLSVGQFRTEIEEDTLSYLWSRSIPRFSIGLGKYVGSTAVILVVLLPLSLLPLGVAISAGAPAPTMAVALAILSTTVLASLAYGAFFLFLGLVTRSALIFGLLFGFLWEELLPLLPGSVPRFTVIFYLRSLASDLVASGPLAGYPMAVASTAAVGVLLLVAAVFVALTCLSLRYVEIAPQRASA